VAQWFLRYNIYPLFDNRILEINCKAQNDKISGAGNSCFFLFYGGCSFNYAFLGLEYLLEGQEGLFFSATPFVFV